MAKIVIKRIYEPAQPGDGFRVLVDRLWPRGIKKENAKIDAWPREIAPSPALRKWFSHDPSKWAAFRQSYKKELKNSKALADLVEIVKKSKKVTLLYAARDEEHNHAVILQQWLAGK